MRADAGVDVLQTKTRDLRSRMNTLHPDSACGGVYVSENLLLHCARVKGKLRRRSGPSSLEILRRSWQKTASMSGYLSFSQLQPV